MIELLNKFRQSELNIIIIVFVIVKLAIHIYSDSISGYHWDELLHIACGDRLDWGYADFPPMIGFLAWIQNWFNSEIVFINRFFIHLTGIATYIVSAMLITKLNGGKKALVITMLCLTCSPLVWTSHSLFLPVGFNQFFQLLAIFFGVCYYTKKQNKYIYLLTVVLAFGFLTKYLIGYLFITLIASILLFDRKILSKISLWKALLIFILIILPNVIWQIVNGFPVLKHISALIDTDLNNSSLFDELLAFMRFFNPVVLLISFIGLFVFTINKDYKTYRVIGFALLSMFFLIIFTNGKFYYTAPAIIPAIALGSLSIEKWIRNKSWQLYVSSFLIIITGIFLVPHGIPLMKPGKYAKLYKLETTDDGRIPIYFQHFYSKTLWPKVVLEFKKIANNLPTNEKVIIWGKHYAYSGIVDLYREEYDLPLAINHMGVYHNWIPELDKNATFITTGERNLTKDFWLQFFNSVEEINMISVKYSWDYQNSGIRFYICKGLKYNTSEIKQMIDKFYGI